MNMSRLYAWLFSDTRKTELTTRGHEIVTLRVNCGSKDNSKPLALLSVVYPEGSEKPEIDLTLWKDVTIRIHKHIKP